jgi:hypothetical protein
VRDDDVGVRRDGLELRGEERLAVPSGRVEGPVVEPRLPRRARQLEAEQLDALVFQVVAAQPVGEAPPLDRLVMVAGHEYDLLRRDAIEPVLERSGEERLLAAQVALERVRDVAGDEQQFARRTSTRCS